MPPELVIIDDKAQVVLPTGKYLYLQNTRPYDADESDTAGKIFMNWRVRSKASSDDARAMYLRLYLDTAGGGGEALRAFTTVNDVAAANAHGAHISLNFNNTGTITGQGIAGRNTLHLPNVALASNVTLAALQAEIWNDGTGSDPGDSTLLSFLRFVMGGNAEGIAKTIDSIQTVLFDVQGVAASGDGVNGLFRSVAPSTLAASLKVRVGSTLYYLPLYSGQS